MEGRSSDPFPFQIENRQSKIDKGIQMTEQLWAPWRLKYIESAGKTEGCIFCEFPAQGEAHDAENLIVYRGQHTYIILNAFPYSNGHLMIVPYRHTDTLDAYSDEEMLDIMQVTRLALKLLKAAYLPEAFNLGVNFGRAAGAGITHHLHWHVVPRWVGDTNFMTVMADVRVIPESLQAVYERLRTALNTELRLEK